MSNTGHLPELDLLRSQVADLARELAERDRVLHEQTRHLYVAQTLAHLGSWDWDIRSGRVDWSDEMYRIFGYEPNAFSITVDTFLAVILPDDHDRILASVNEALSGKTPYDQECRIVCPNGEVRTIHCRGEMLRDGNGLPLRMSGSALDITERKRNEVVLQQREAHYRALIEHSSDVITILELDGAIRFESPSFERLLGYAQHELNGRIAFEFIHQEDLPVVTEKFQLLIQKPDIPQIAEFRFRRKDGSWLKFEGIGRAIIDSEGRRCVIVNSRDITERTRAEAMLRTSQEKLKQALQASGTGLWDWNTDTNEVVFSREWKRQLGYEESELPDSFETWETRLHPDDHDGALAYIRAYLARPEKDYRQEFRLRHKDGEYRWIEARASLVTEADGRHIRLLGSHTDISDRKRMEETSQESEERYRALVELSPSGVFVFCEGQTVYVNQMGARIMGAKDSKEILDRPTFEFIHPDYHQEVRDNVKRLLSGGVTLHRAERIYVKMDGTPIPVQVEATRILWNGKPAILGIFSDITERKQGEDRVREMNLALAQAMPGIARVDLDGRYLEVNQPYATMLGYEPSELLGRTWEPSVHPEDLRFAHQAYEQLLEKGKAEFECRAVRKDGSMFFKQVLMVRSKLSLGGFLGHHCFMRDITERKQAEKELADLNATLEQQVCDRTQALRQSEERFRQFFDNAPNVTSLKDSSGRYVYANRRFDEVFGLSPGSALGKTDEDLFSPEQAAQFESHNRSVLTSGWGQEFEEVTQQRDGLHTSIVVKFPVTDASGKLSAIGSIATDITERNRTQEQLRLYREIFTHSIDGIAVIDLQGRYLLQNEAHERIIGYTIDELKEKTPAVHLGEESFARIAQTLATTGSYRGEIESRVKSGRAVTLDLTAFAVKNANGEPVCYVGIKRDVTERNHAQAALRESEARWQQFAESVGSAFWIADITSDERKVLYVNSAFTYIWGIEREEIYQNWSLWLDSIHPDDRMRVKASHDRFIAGGPKAEFDSEYRIVDRDGRVRWISDRRVKMAGWDHRVAGIAEDITHHRQQLALMAQTETIGKIGGWEIDFLTNHLWWSEETYRLHDTTPELYSPTVATALNFYATECRPRMAEAIERGVGQGEPWDLELELVTAKGRQIVVRAVGKVDVVNGRAVRAYGTFQDITDRKRTEEALQEAHDELERKVIERTAELRTSEERYARATAIGKVGVWELDALKGHYYGDANMKALFGYAPDELSLDPVAWLDLVHPDDRSIAIKNWEWVRTGISDLVHYELRMLKKDGSIIWTDVRGMSVRDADGQLTHLIGATVDITERKEAEDALRESEERFAKAFRTSPHPIGITELATGRCIEVNDACLQLFGFSREEVIGNTTLALGIWPKQEDRARLIERVKVGEPVRDLEMSVRTKSGDVRHILVASDVAELNGTLCLITVGNDITDRKRAAEALQRSERDLRTVLDALPIGVWFTDQNGKPIVSNPASQKIWTSAKEVKWGAGERKWTESTEHTTGPHRWALGKVLAHGEPSLNEIFELDCGEEGTKTILNSAVPVRDENGTVLGALVLNEDISDRVKAEEALRISEERFAKAFRASLHPVVISELDSGRVLDANDAAYQLFGYSQEDVVGRTTLQIGLWHSAEERARYLDQLKRQGSIRNVEVTLRSKNGEVRQCLLSSELIELNGKQCSVTVGDDITERKRAESTLRRSEERLRRIFEHAGTGIAFGDAEGRYIQCNPAYCEIVGYTEEELRQTSFAQLIHPEDYARNLNLVEQLAHNSIPSFEVENRYVHKDGHTILVQKFVTGLRGDDGRLTHFIALVTDISERKRAETALQRSHTFLRQIIDTDPNFIFAKDRTGRFALVNRAVADCYGCTVEDLIGKSDADFNPNKEEVAYFRQKDLEVMNSLRECFIAEEQITDSKGTVRWLQTVKRPILDDHGQAHMVLSAATDITERKRMEEMLLQRERDLSAALHERERISQDLHDGILQALYAIGLGLEGCKPLIQKQQDKTASKVMTGLNRAIGQLNHVMAEVRNFIAGLESHVMQGGDFPTALRSMVQTMCSSASTKCRVNIDNEAARHVSTEQALHIINIVREGLSNALRHSGATCITVSFRPLIRSVRLTVADDGVGFDPRSIHGLGHGLANMAARAQKVGGLLTVRSEPDRGTRILLDLPKDITYDSN